MKKLKRILSLLLVCTMLCSATNVTIFAERIEKNAGELEIACTKTEQCTLPDGHEGDCSEPIPDLAPPAELPETTETETELPLDTLEEKGAVTTPGDFKAAFDADGTVTLGGDIVLSDNATIEVKNKSVLDLNNYTITVSGARTKILFNLTAGGSLSVQDTSTGKNGKIDVTGALTENLIYVNSATSVFTMEGGTLNATNISVAKALVRIDVGSFSMSGGSISAMLGNTDARTVLMSAASGDFRLSGGKIYAKNNGNITKTTALYINECNSATLTGGEIITENEGAGATFTLWLKGTSNKGVVLDGVTVNGSTTGAGAVSAIYMDGQPTIDEIGGTTVITATSTQKGDVYALNCTGGTVGKITGGTFTAKGAGTKVRAAYFTANNNRGDNQSITGGTFAAESSGNADAVGIYIDGETSYLGELGGDVKISATELSGKSGRAIYNVRGHIRRVTGGTYTAPKGIDSTGTVGFTTGKELTNNGSNVWTLTDAPLLDESTAVAKIGTTLYASLPDAMGAVEEGKTIVLLNDIQSASAINASCGYAFTIDLNGHTLNSPANCIVLYGVGTELTLTDSATVKGGIVSTAAAGIFIRDSAMLIGNGVAVTGARCGIDVYGTPCGATLSDCTVTATAGNALEVTTANTVTVNGGTYTGSVYGITTGNANVVINSIDNAQVFGAAYGIYNIGTIKSVSGTQDTGAVCGIFNSKEITLIGKDTVLYGNVAMTGGGTVKDYDPVYTGFVRDTTHTGTPAKWILGTGEVIPDAPVAKVGEVGYATFGEAFATVKTNGGSIQLIADSTEAAAATFEIPAGKEVIVDLNGHTLTVGIAASLFTNKGKLSIIDSTATAGARGAGAIRAQNANKGNHLLIDSTSTGENAVVLKNVSLSLSGTVGYGVKLNGKGSTGSVEN